MGAGRKKRIGRWFIIQSDRKALRNLALWGIKLKRIQVVFYCFVLAVVTVFGIGGIKVLQSAYRNEIRTVQSIAGKVISEYPETENVFTEALRDMERESADVGVDILARYGYDEDEKIRQNPSYSHTLHLFLALLSVFLLFSLFGMFLYFHILEKRKHKQEDEILRILEKCIAGDYSFLEEEDALQKFYNPLFTDMLMKFGRKLKLKTEWLEEEHDNTKMLATDISHQLKTPISALKVCFPLCMEAESEEEREEFITRCMLQMEKLEMLAAALGNLSHLETHIIKLRPEEAAFIDILTKSVNAVYEKALKKQITIENVTENTEEVERLRLYIDAKWTVEAVANVLDNAIKYSPCGSSILIRVQKLYSFVRVEIEDQGIGIPKEERNQIFRRFYRGNNDYVNKQEGVGVGLYLARKLLEDEGGSIFVRPAKEQGSIFVLQLPL